jgi:hypothetical protein
MELWCAEPHLTPRIYDQLNPEERRRLVLHLAFLLLKLGRHLSASKTSPTSGHTHER